MLNSRRYAAGILAVMAATAIAAPVSAQSFTFDRTVPVTGIATIDVSSGRGKIVVRQGDADEVVIAGTVTVRNGINVPPSARQLAQATADKPPVKIAGNLVTLRVPEDPMVRAAVTVSYDIQVPATARVILVTDSGAIRVEGTGGALSIKTSSAEIAVVAPTGESTIDTGSGDVTIEDARGPVSVTTKSSRISVRGQAATLTARTGSGQVGVVFAGRGDVDVQTQSSAIAIEGIDGGLKVVTGSGAVRIMGAPRSAWAVTTGSSAIDVKLGGDTSANVDVTTTSGSVTTEKGLVTGSIQPRRVTGTINGGGPALTLTSRSGSITVR